MKKSRIAKFALLGASAAALAATLSTSTYAWYVSNKTANVEAVAGSTASGTSDNTIAVSLTGARNDYHKTISLTDKTTGLLPLLRKNATLTATGAVGAKYYGLNETVDPVILKTTEEGAGWYTYEFYMLASVNCTVATALTVTNTTQNFSTLTQVNYSGGGYVKVTGDSAPTWAANKYYSYSAGSYTVTSTEPGDWDTNWNNYYVLRTNVISGVDPSAKFTVDAIQACSISLAVETGKFASANDDAAYAKNDTTTVPAEYTSSLTAAATGYSAPDGTGYGTVHTASGAHAYYEFMTNKTLAQETKNAYTGSALSNISLTAGVPVRLYYSIWLDGSNELCFNACQGQTLSVAFDYTATPTNS